MQNLYLNRDGGIRTHGPLVPNEVRYQTALHPDDFRRPQCMACRKCLLSVSQAKKGEQPLNTDRNLSLALWIPYPDNQRVY